MQQQQKQLGSTYSTGANFSTTVVGNSATKSPNSSVDRKASARSTPVHLSSATRERLWARSTGQTTTTASSSGTSGGPTTSIGHNGGAGGGRNRRLSGNHGTHYNIYTDKNGLHKITGAADSSMNGSVTAVASNTTTESLAPPGYNNIHHYQKVEASSSDTIQSMRYANSLESLDAVSTSIQQARAQSSQLHHQIEAAHNGQKHYLTSAPKMASGSTEAIHHNPQPNMLYSSRNYTSSHGPFQRTFPLRKSTSSHGRSNEDDFGANSNSGQQSHSKDQPYDVLRLQLPQNWKPEPDSTNTSATSSTDPFWTPTRTRRATSNTSTASKTRSGGITNGHHPDSTEIQRLRRDLREEQERVQRLSAQLTTNAHVVSAFEHSLGNMTSRLEQLNDTSNRKDRELLDLRKIINNLKEKNDLGDQFQHQGAPSRWKSDDNMLADCSDMNHDNNKVSRSGSSRFLRGKKNTWFRSSLTKAFGKNKSSGNLSNGCHDQDDGERQHCETSNNATISSSINMAKHRSISTSALDESIIDDLQRQLNVKDDLLTETRLEALSSASQLQALREQVAKLRTELRIVKKENEDLKQTTKLNTPQKSIKNHNNQEEWIDSSLVIESSNLNVYDEALDIPVIIVINAVPSPMEIRIGSIRVRKNENLSEHKPWKDLDMNVQCLFGLYLARLDPFECLGLSGETSIESYEFMGRVRKMLGHFDFIDDIEEDNSASPAYIATHTRIMLKLKCLDELAFGTLRPIIQLQPFTEDLITSPRPVAWIQGQSGCSKTFFAKRIAEYLIKSKRRGSNKDKLINDDLISLINLKDCDSETLENKFESLSLRVRVVILDDIQDPQSDMFQNVAIGKMAEMPNVTFLCVSQNQESYIPPKQSWTYLSLSNSTDPRLESAFLGYLLRRRVLSIETLTLKANDSMIVAVNWLNRIHAQLVDYCRKYSIPMPSMKYFLVKDLPLESSHQFRIWFVDLWNLVLVEEFKKELEGKPLGTVSSGDDPIQIVTRSWPWKDLDGGFSQSLRPLFKHSLHTNNDNDAPADDNIFNKDPLMDMLLCLQEATKDTSIDDTSGLETTNSV